LSKDTRIIWRGAFTFGTVMTALGLSQGFRVGFSVRLVLVTVVLSAVGALLVGGVLLWFVGRGASRLERQGIGFTNTEPVQERSVEVALPATAAFEASLSALRVIPKIRVVRENRSAGEIDARTRMTWRSFGELVTIRVLSLGGDRARIDIRSEPATKQKVDYGKSVENVELILRAMARPTQARGQPRSDA
jgi:hypothetical protein